MTGTALPDMILHWRQFCSSIPRPAASALLRKVTPSSPPAHNSDQLSGFSLSTSLRCLFPSLTLLSGSPLASLSLSLSLSLSFRLAVLPSVLLLFILLISVSSDSMSEMNRSNVIIRVGVKVYVVVVSKMNEHTLTHCNRRIFFDACR